MTRTLWNFDPTLASLRGHYFPYAKSLAQAAEARGWRFRSYVHVNCDANILAEVRGTPLFHEDMHVLRSRLPVIGSTLNYLLQNRVIHQSLQKIPPSQFSRNDIALFHTVTQNQIAGIVKWWQGLPPASRPHLVLLLRYSNLSHGADGTRRISRRSVFYKLALSHLRHSDAITIATDSDGLAQEYKSLLNWDRVVVLPIPHLPTRTRPEKPVLDPVLRVASLGDARAEKGFCLIAEAAGRLAATHPEILFLLQSNFSADAGQPITDAVRSLSAMGPTVQTFAQALSSEDYDALLQEADLVLIPYDPAVYEDRTSGVFSEALALGTPVITTAGTWMERELKKLGLQTPVMQSFSADALQDAIIAFSRDAASARAEFRKASGHWNEFHSAAHYLDMLDALAKN